MQQEKVVGIQNEQRDALPPIQTPLNLVDQSPDGGGLPRDCPYNRKNARVAVLVVFVCFTVARRRPDQRLANEPILDRRQVCIVLDDGNELYVQPVASSCPHLGSPDPFTLVTHIAL